MPSYWIRPSTDEKADWTESPAGTAWSILNDAVVQPTAPSTTSGWVESATAGQLSRHKLTVPVLAANEIPQALRWWAYLTVPAGAKLTIQGGPINHDVVGAVSNVWTASVWMRPSTMDQAFLDALTVQLNAATVVASPMRVYTVMGELVTEVRKLSVHTGAGFAVKPHLTNIGGSWVEKVPVKRP